MDAKDFLLELAALGVVPGLMRPCDKCIPDDKHRHDAEAGRVVVWHVNHYPRPCSMCDCKDGYRPVSAADALWAMLEWAKDSYWPVNLLHVWQDERWQYEVHVVRGVTRYESDRWDDPAQAAAQAIPKAIEATKGVAS